MSDWIPEQPELEPATKATGEPVVIAQAVTLIISMAVGAGWLTLDDQMISLVATAVGLIVVVVTTVLARARVSPLKGGLVATVYDVVNEVVTQVVADRVKAELAQQRRAPAHAPARTPRESWRQS